MKIICAALLVLAALSLPGQEKLEPKITLTAQDVKAGSIRVITSGPDDTVNNLIFRYRQKTHDEIQAILKSHPRVQICKGNTVVVKDAGCGGYRSNPTNLVGLVLLFHSYDDLKLAEKTLHGDK